MKTIKFLGLEYEVSNWVMYVARDINGEVYGYEVEPRLSSGYYWNMSDDCGAEHLFNRNSTPICEYVGEQ